MSDKKSADATFATWLLDNIILERHLTNILPNDRKYSLQMVKKITGQNFLPIRDYINSDLFTVHKTYIEITEDTQLLSEKSRDYCEELIKKLVYPSQYKHDNFIYNIGKLFDSSYYTADEKSFIDLMLDKLFCIINDEFTVSHISHRDLLKFNLVYDNGIKYVARDIYNAIIQKKIHTGDNIISYFATDNLTAFQIADTLDKAEKYDFFFNKFSILKCDLEKNRNILIKNFINAVLYDLRDIVARFVLLQKLNTKYPFLIRDKIFDDFE